MVRGSNPRGSDTSHTHPYLPWGPPSFVYSGYRLSFVGVRRLNHPPPSRSEVQERVLLNQYNSSRPSWSALKTVPCFLEMTLIHPTRTESSCNLTDVIKLWLARWRHFTDMEGVSERNSDVSIWFWELQWTEFHRRNQDHRKTLSRKQNPLFAFCLSATFFGPSDPPSRSFKY